jgi:DNA-binding MarR family transcriptional regulator
MMASPTDSRLLLYGNYAGIVPDLSKEALSLLTHVRLIPGTSVTKLSKLLRMTPRAVGVLVVQLQENGWLEARGHPDHPNARELHLTPLGVSTVSGQGQ